MVSKELEEQYNGVCVGAYLRLHRLCQSRATVDLTDIDLNLKSHRVVLAIAKAYGGIVSKKVRVDMKRDDLKQINSRLDKDCWYQRLPFTARKGAISIHEIVEVMRTVAAKLSPNNPVSIDDIYDEFFGGN